MESSKAKNCRKSRRCLSREELVELGVRNQEHQERKQIASSGTGRSALDVSVYWEPNPICQRGFIPLRSWPAALPEVCLVFRRLSRVLLGFEPLLDSVRQGLGEVLVQAEVLDQGFTLLLTSSRRRLGLPPTALPSSPVALLYLRRARGASLMLGECC